MVTLVFPHVAESMLSCQDKPSPEATSPDQSFKVNDLKRYFGIQPSVLSKLNSRFLLAISLHKKLH